MNALDHALKWINGELMEGSAILVFGCLLILSSGLLWKFGLSPSARALIVPLLCLGSLLLLLSVPGILNNFRRIPAFSEAYALDPQGFMSDELARVHNFMTWYFYTFLIGSVLIIGGLVAFLLFAAPSYKAIGLVMILLGTTGLFIDHVSKGRAIEYLGALTQIQTGQPLKADPPKS